MSPGRHSWVCGRLKTGSHHHLPDARAILRSAPSACLRCRLVTADTVCADFYVAALKESIARYGRPEIFNTDHGSPFASFASPTG